MGSVLAIKVALMIAFFLEVTIFGNCISGLACFHNKRVMDLAMTFSGTLFLSIAMIDVIPEAIASFDEFFEEHSAKFESSSSFHRGKLPLTMIIATVTMLIIMSLDKLVIGHSHDHQYEISFTNEPRKREDGQSVELKKRTAADLANPDTEHNENNIGSERLEREHHHKKSGHQSQINWKPFILQIGMSIHAFFQTLALGLQRTSIGVLSLASAILVHKWAEGLTLGLMYKKEGFSGRMAIFMVVIQGCINILGLVVGTILTGQGNFVMAFFMSMSAGTFFYISLGEVLQEQLRQFTKGKLVMVLLANFFIAFIVWFEKAEESSANQAEKAF